MIEELAFTYPTWFFEILCEFEGSPLVLEDFQIRYLLDNNQFKITNKTRQSGGSMQIALSKMFKAYRQTNYRCDIVSINLKEATDKIKYVRNFWESLPMRYRIPLTIDNALSIGFHKGKRQSTIHSLAASAGVRGGKKEMVFDEFAHIPQSRELFLAAAPAILNGNLSLELNSTPMGDRNLFAEIWKNEADPSGQRLYDMFTRHQFIWLDVRRFVTNYEQVQYLWYEKYNQNFDYMEELIQEYATPKLKMFKRMFPWSIFKQEFCGVFIDETNAFFPWELIKRCLRGTVGKADDQEEEFLEPWKKRPEDNDNPVFMGVDFGESEEDSDKTSIQVVERDPNNGRVYHRYSEILSKDTHPDFPSQAEHIAKIIKRMKPQKVSCDETGLGRGIVPLIRRFVPNVHIEGVNFHNLNKEGMVMDLKTLMEQELLWLQADDHVLHNQIRGIQRDISPTGQARYHGEPYDDAFWALALATRGGVYKEFSIYRLGDKKPI